MQRGCPNHLCADCIEIRKHLLVSVNGSREHIQLFAGPDSKGTGRLNAQGVPKLLVHA